MNKGTKAVTGGNGTFEFTGKFDEKGAAGGRGRKGTLTVKPVN
ncbi:MAG: hypothetical protein WCP55_24725 [Lentisphaerota bacterium]